MFSTCLKKSLIVATLVGGAAMMSSLVTAGGASAQGWREYERPVYRNRAQQRVYRAPRQWERQGYTAQRRGYGQGYGRQESGGGYSGVLPNGRRYYTPPGQQLPYGQSYTTPGGGALPRSYNGNN